MAAVGPGLSVAPLHAGRPAAQMHGVAGSAQGAIAVPRCKVPGWKATTAPAGPAAKTSASCRCGPHTGTAEGRSDPSVPSRLRIAEYARVIEGRRGQGDRVQIARIWVLLHHAQHVRLSSRVVLGWASAYAPVAE